MKKVLILLLTALLFSCSDEEKNTPLPEPEEPETPSGQVVESTVTRTLQLTIESRNSNERILRLEETIKDEIHVDKTDTYTFLNDQLVKHYIEQTYYPEFTTTFQKDLTYSENTVIVTDQNENTLTYSLNEKGYATKCIQKTADQTRTYYFKYSADDYLTQIKEDIDGKPFSSLDLAYQNGDITTVISTMREEANQINYQAGEELNTDGLPCIGLSETYPLSTHIEALYAGMLGKPAAHLTAKTTPEGNDTEWNTYSYSKNNTGNSYSIMISTHYKGIVYPSPPPPKAF